ASRDVELFRRDLFGAGRPIGENVLQYAGIAQFAVTLVDRLQQSHDGVRDILLELRVPVVLPGDLVERLAGAQGQDDHQAPDARFIRRIVANLATGVRYGFLELAADDVRWVQEEDRTVRIVVRLRHLLG